MRDYFFAREKLYDLALSSKIFFVMLNPFSVCKVMKELIISNITFNMSKKIKYKKVKCILVD